MDAAGPLTTRLWLARGIERFPTNYFALVMATGICSIAAHLLAMPFVAHALFVTNVVCFVVLAVMFVARLVMHPKRVFTDLCAHHSGPGFFTIIAAINVLGIEFVLLAQAHAVAEWLWWASIVVWFVVMYVFFVATIVR